MRHVDNAMIANPAANSVLARSMAAVTTFPSASEPRLSAGLFVLGATHRTASLAVRERLALNAEAQAGLSLDLAAIRGLREFVILSTCNRLEVYGVASFPGVEDHVERALCSRQGIPAAEFAAIRLRLDGESVLRHLLAVAVGLDSQMLGETEIFGQLKKAYAAAQTRGTTGALLNRIFQKVFQGAKHVRSSTAITVGQTSVATVAVELAEKIFRGLESARILLLGAGEIGEKTARAFRSRGAASLTVASRHSERAEALARELDAGTLPFDQRENRLAEFDIIVSSTSAAAAVLGAEAVRRAMRVRPAQPLLLIDLAMPRDIEAGAAGANGVFLFNLDDLAKIAEANRAARAAEIDKCRLLLEERAAAIWQQAAAQLSAWPQALAS